MTINKRIDLIIKYLSIEQGQFADSINEKDSFISRIVNNSTSEPGFNKIAKIYQTYSQINPHWLLTGEGDMLKDGKSSPKISVANHLNGDNNHINVGDCEKERKHLQEIIAEKEKIIQEKERTIQILLNK